MLMLGLLGLVQLATGQIDGTVRSDAGRPIAGAVVTIDALERRVEADPAGRFSLREIPPGRWQVSIAADGYAAVTLRAEVAPNATTRIDIGLAARGEDDRPSLEIIVLSDDGGPLDLATVSLAGQVRTSAGGRATFRGLDPGQYRLRIQRLGYASIDTLISHGSGVDRVSVRLMPRPRDLPPLDVVAAPRSPRTSTIAAPGDLAGALATGFTRLSHEEIRSVPPAFEPDVLRALQATAGIGAANDINAHPAIRGGAPEHTLFLLDGAPVLAPYHMFGLFGAFNPDAVDEVQVLRGSLPARIGGALGSVISLRSARPDRPRLTGGATVLTSRLAGSGPIGDGGSWLLAGRRTNLGFGESGPFDIDMPYWFWDLQGTVRVKPARDQEITATGYGSGDKFIEDLFFVDQGSAPLFSSWGNRVASIGWRLTRARGFDASASIWRSTYQSLLALGDTALRVDGAVTRGRTRMQGASIAIGGPVGRGTLRFDAAATATSAKLAGDSASPGYLDDQADRKVVELSSSLELEQRIGPVTAAPGVRLTRWSSGRQWSLEPRVTVRLESPDGTQVSASVGRTEQALFALRDDRLPILGVPFWLLPDSAEPRARATAFEVAAARTLGTGWKIEAAVVHRRLTGLPRWRPAGTRDLAELAFDAGTVTGLELSLTRQSGRLTGWVTYAPLVSSVRDERGEQYRPLWDRRHTVDAVFQIRLGSWGTISQRIAAATGQPFWAEQGMFTGSEFDPVTGTVRPRTDADFPIWSTTQGRLPLYFRADLTMSGSWRIGGIQVSPFAGLINLTGRRNVAGYRVQPGGLANTLEYLPRRQLPRLPVLGVDITIAGSRSVSP